MKLATLEIENLRCYKEKIKVDFSNLTTFIGKNDIGKSTILDALEIFFNNSTVKISKEDSCINSEESIVRITCEFIDIPPTLTLDSGSETTLEEEYLLTESGTLKIQKRYDCGKKTPSCEVFIIANHPNEKAVSSLLELKEKDLQKIIKDRGIECALKGNPVMRKAIWGATEDLDLREVELAVTKPKRR